MLVAVLVAQTGAIVLLGVLVVGLLRSHGDVLRQLHRLGAGIDAGSGDARSTSGPVDVPLLATGSAPATHVRGVTLDGEEVALPLTGDRDLLLAFLSGGCASCEPFWETLSRAVLPAGAELLVVAQGPELESTSLLRRLAPAGAPLVLSTSAWEDFGVPGSPHFAYVSGRDGRVLGEGMAAGWAEVTRLAEQAVADRREAQRAVADRTPPGTRTDQELAAAGIGPGDPRLFSDPAAFTDPLHGAGEA